MIRLVIPFFRPRSTLSIIQFEITPMRKNTHKAYSAVRILLLIGTLVMALHKNDVIEPANKE